MFGAVCLNDGVRFRVHAPAATRVDLVLEGPVDGERAMVCGNDGIWELYVDAARSGQRYRVRLDGADPLPDPASRFQPRGVHEASEVVDPAAFRWTDVDWTLPHPRTLVVYELHVGTFTPEGTFTGVRSRLPYLRDLGVTAIELMPIADFAGLRNWGYDGVALFAPSRAYGHPDDLRALVDAAHAEGIAVMLDVVYNHLGPEGAYLPRFNPQYIAGAAETPWGRAVNLDATGNELVREFIVDNAVHWLREYHLDGLRLDATHTLIDTNRPHFLRQFATRVRAAAGRRILLHAEDHRNLDQIVLEEGPEDWGFDAVWADDFHHIIRRMIAGDEHAYYADFEGTSRELERTIRQGWLYTGEHSRHLNTRRGTSPTTIPMRRFVVCIQNHDQIGNRALGERLHHQVDAATWRAVSFLLLISPMTPLLFMGQEWSASTPFTFFTDMEEGLGRMITAGRRREFQAFPQFTDLAVVERIPDPQAPDTFLASSLRWHEQQDGAHAATLALYRRLLTLRRTEPALGASEALDCEAFAADENSIVVRRSEGVDEFWAVVRLRGSGSVDVGRYRTAMEAGVGTWQLVLSTDDDEDKEEKAALRIDLETRGPVVHFTAPGGALFRVVTQQ
jgi:maltooligosyltrehalose trehalohydrolase